MQLSGYDIARIDIQFDSALLSLPGSRPEFRGQVMRCMQCDLLRFRLGNLQASYWCRTIDEVWVVLEADDGADGNLLEPRWGMPEDVGRAVAMLVRGDLPYAPGQVLTVDGGLSMKRL